MTSTEAWQRISEAFQYLAAGGSETRTARGDLFEELARVTGEMATIGVSGGPASQLDSDGVTLDVNVINDGEVLRRVGTTIVSAPVGAPGAHAVTHEDGGIDEINVAGLSGVLVDPQIPIIGPGGAQAVAGNDARLGNARTPTAHAVTHQPGGTDAMAVDAAAGTGSLRTLGTGATQAAAGNHGHVEADVTGLVADLAARALTTDPRFTDARTPTAHKLSHQNGGTDKLDLTGLNGVLADPQPPIIGATGTTAVAGNDSRLTDARTPLGHHVSHENGGTDQMSVAGLTGLLATAQIPAAHTHPEADIIGLIADLAAKAVIGQILGKVDPGNMSLADGQYSLHYKRLSLSGAERFVASGASTAVVTDLGSPVTLPVLGSPKNFNGDFRVPNDYKLFQSDQMCLVGQTRAYLEGNARAVITDSFGSRSRLVLAGRGS